MLTNRFCQAMEEFYAFCQVFELFFGDFVFLFTAGVDPDESGQASTYTKPTIWKPLRGVVFFNKNGEIKIREGEVLAEVNTFKSKNGFATSIPIQFLIISLLAIRAH